MTKTAVMIDGAFFLKRYGVTYGRGHTPQQTAKDLFTMSLSHVAKGESLYRIFFYDCPPLNKKAHNPVTNRSVDFSKTPVHLFRTELHRELVKIRKLALRMGRLAEYNDWVITPRVTKKLLSGKSKMSEMSEKDVAYSVTQKGVDMRIGLDIASLAYKKLADRIVLVTGDADFVPAAKLARREGIDVVLDPMWQRVSDDLFEHIDGLKSVCRRPRLR